MTQGNGQGEPKGKEPVDWVMDLFVHTPIGLAVMAWKRMPEFVGSVPDLVGQAMSKGCAQLAEAEERLSEEVRKARMIGQVAVTFGGRQLRREVDARLRDARQAAGGVTSFIPGMAGGGPNGADADAAAAAKVSATATATATATPSAPASPPSTEPAAAKTSATKRAAKAAAAKAPAAKAPAKKATARKPAAKATGARKAAKTSAADLPIPEYDGLSASQVVSRLSGLSPEELRAIRSYEETGRGRRTVLAAVDKLLG
jgi:hypothetical protein